MDESARVSIDLISSICGITFPSRRSFNPIYCPDLTHISRILPETWTAVTVQRECMVITSAEHGATQAVLTPHISGYGAGAWSPRHVRGVKEKA